MTGTIGIEEIANGTETTLEEDQSKRMYDDCVKPRIDDKDYSKVFVALAFNPELKKHLFQTEESLAEDYFETEARERFNLRMPGEKVVTVIPSTEDAQEEERKWWNPFTW